MKERTIVWVFTFVMLYGLAQCAKAEPLDVIVGGWSYHVDRTRNHNEVHNTLGACYAGYCVAGYRNSNRGDTVVLTRDFLTTPLMQGVEVSLFAGIATGYSSGGEPTASGGAKLSYTRGRLGFDVHYLPGVVSYVQMRYRLDKDYTGWHPHHMEKWRIGYGYGTTGGTLWASRDIGDGYRVRGYISNGKHKWYDEWSEAWQIEHIHARMLGMTIDKSLWHENLSVYGGVAYNGLEYSTRYYITADGCEYMGFLCHDDTLDGLVTWDRVSAVAGIRYEGKGWYAELGLQSLSGIRGELKYKGASVAPEFVERELDKYSEYDALYKLELGFWF